MPMEKRWVDTALWLKEIEGILQDGNDVSLTVTGSSMLPFLRHEKDSVLLSPIQKPVQKGDILLYKRPNGQYVLHRVVRKKGDDLFLCGDAQYTLEGPLSSDCALAIVTKAKRRGKWIGKGNPVWFFFRKIWPNILPLRKLLVRAYLKKK